MGDLKERAWRNDAVAKVTGAARYADDIKLHGMLHAVPVYTDHVSATINTVHTEMAAAAPGVLRVITAKDAPGTVVWGQIHRDCRMLVDDRIRCHGDVVAVVVAETRGEAIRAAALVTVDAEDLPALFDPEEALKDGAPLVHPAHGSNVVNHHVVRKGDVDGGLASSDLVIEQEFCTQHIEHAYLEPESAVCALRPDGVMEVHGSMQHPFSTRRFVAAILGVPLNAVEVRSVPMGGGFGGKDDTAAIVCARAALAAKLTGRPVRMTYDREWSIRESYKRHPYVIRYTMGLSKDGKIRAVRVRMVADAGAYCSVTPWVTWRSTVQCCGPYEVPHVHCDVYGVYTNNVFTGAMRGFGSPQVNFAIEQLIEIAGERLGIPEIEIRRRNMVRQGSVTVTGQELDEHTVSLGQVLDEVLKASSYEEKRARCAMGGGGDAQYGIGLAVSYRGMSLGAEGTDFNSAIVSVQPDGSILLEAGVHENGQGAESTMVLLLAGTLGVRRERIRYRQASTSNIPDGGTTVASRATLMGGGAVVNAAKIIRQKIAEFMAPRWGLSEDDLAFADDEVRGRTPAQRIPFDEVIRLLYAAQEYPYAFGVFRAPRVSWDEHTGQGNAYFTWVYGCQAVELTVSRKTGKVTLLNAWAAHDVGRAVNPAMLKGQFYGGIAMGTGYALLEEVKMEKGRISTLNFDRYRIPRATDLPEMHAIIVENEDPLSPSGAKGIGEPSNELMAPAIANAVCHATGKRFTRLPIKVEAVG